MDKSKPWEDSTIKLQTICSILGEPVNLKYNSYIYGIHILRGSVTVDILSPDADPSIKWDVIKSVFEASERLRCNIPEIKTNGGDCIYQISYQAFILLYIQMVLKAGERVTNDLIHVDRNKKLIILFIPELIFEKIYPVLEARLKDLIKFYNEQTQNYSEILNKFSLIYAPFKIYRDNI